MATKSSHARTSEATATERPAFVPLEPDPWLREPRPLFGNQIRWAKWVIRESRREKAWVKEARRG
ncbi:MAG TPA: hypothetical protein VN618_00350 [Solirubrobacteraceae bacterium]|nr:hypothetical protein [Solirubrobacteraceae bacterium]